MTRPRVAARRLHPPTPAESWGAVVQSDSFLANATIRAPADTNRHGDIPQALLLQVMIKTADYALCIQGADQTPPEGRHFLR